MHNKILKNSNMTVLELFKRI